MTETCLVAEDVADCVSVVTSEVVVVAANIMLASSATVAGVTPPPSASLAVAADVATSEHYAICAGGAIASDWYQRWITTATLVSSDAEVVGSTIALFYESHVSTADSESHTLFDAEAIAVGTAGSSSAVVVDRHGNITLASQAVGASSVVTGLLEQLTAVANVTDSATALRLAATLVADVAHAVSEADAGGAPAFPTLQSIATAASAVFSQLVAASTVADLAAAEDGVWFKDPGRVAWVMNTETSAGSWYDNFDFSSIAQVGGRVFAVGPDGLYELVGATDSGEAVDALLQTGFVDFGSQNIKRIDNAYFGYTSGGTLDMTLETQDSNHAPQTFVLETRDATAPRTTRVVPGKGMWGRYWRFTFRNVNGAAFDVRSATVDIAESNRRL